MDNLELKQLTVQYKRVNAAREEMECKIMEFQDQIKRIEDNIAIQVAKENEIQGKIQELKNKKGDK